MTEGAREQQGRELGGMRTRTAARVAWALLVLSFTLTVLSLWLVVLNLSYPGVHIYDFWVESTLAAMGFSTVGTVISTAHPG